MNWTEGNLARHSRGRANNEVLKRQKEHFAKARSRVLGGNVKKSPISISFLDPAQSHNVLPFTRRSTFHVQGESPPRRRSHQFDGSRSPVPLLRTKFREFDTHERDSSKDRRESPVDLVSTVQTSTRKRSALAEIVIQEQTNEKRRRLLQNPDWAGLEMQQPLDLVLPGQRRMASGRVWSKVEPSDAKYGGQQRARIVLPDSRRASRQQLESSRQERPSGPIRVQIGSQSVTHTADTNEWLSSEEQGQVPEMLQTRSRRVAQIERTRESSISSDPKHREYSDSITSMSRSSCSRQFEGGVSPAIHHPIPRRLDMSTVLQWSPSSRSSDSGSLHAQIGRPKRRPPSEIADNERWLRHIMPEDKLSIPLTRGSSLLDSPPYRPAISPGISELLSQHTHLPHEYPEGSVVESSSGIITSPGYIQTSNQSMAVPSTIDDNSTQTNKTSFLNPSHGVTTHTAQTTKQKQQLTKLDKSFADDHCLSTLADGAVNRLNIKEQPQPVDDSRDSRPHTKFPLLQAVDDAAWMKFIYGDSENETQAEAFREAINEVTKELRSPRTSRKRNDLTCGDDSGETEESHGFNQSVEAQKGSDVTSSGYATTSISATRGSKSPGFMQSDQDLEDMTTDFLASSTRTSRRDSISPPPPSTTPSVSDLPTTDPPKSDQATVDESIISEIPQPVFRFAAPQSFVGKLAGSSADPDHLLQQHSVPKNRRSGPWSTSKRSRKTRSDGRTDIRALPDFHDDPIEE
ncbi:hypothetical protein BJ166DRAFT_214560 [Pestalotiopsis sp. NC0098]|nr:hypothetical protein BJ166DRAFT_214560 [Pestalotiopsis sp. NC0098]